MKLKITSLFVCMVCAWTISAQRVLFFNETFGTDAGGSAIAVNTYDVGKPWSMPGITVVGNDPAVSIITTYVSSKLPSTTCNKPWTTKLPYQFASGGNNLYMNVTTAVCEIHGINTSGYSDLKLQFAYWKNGTSTTGTNGGTANFTLSYSINEGEDWVRIDSLVNGTSGDSVGWHLTPVYPLPAEAQFSNLYLKIKRNGGNIFRVDDVQITGIKSSAPTAKEATAKTETGFTTNWDALSALTPDKYLLEVSTSPTFSLATTDTVVGWMGISPDDGYATAAPEEPSLSQPYATVGNILNKDIQLLTENATGHIYSGATSNDNAYVVRGWEDGNYSKYFLLKVNTTGYYNLTFNLKCSSSGTGPANFYAQYRIGDTGEWFDVPNSSVQALSGKGDGSLTLDEIPLPGACSNQADLNIRYIQTSLAMQTPTASATNIGASGTHRLYRAFIKGQSGSFVEGYAGKEVTGVEEALAALPTDAIYYYRVRAQKDNYFTEYSEPVSVTLGNPPTALPSVAADYLSVYYDKAAGSLVVRGDASGATIKILDVNGSTVAKFLPGAQQTFNLSQLSSGLYIAVIETLHASSPKAVKFVK